MDPNRPGTILPATDVAYHHAWAVSLQPRHDGWLVVARVLGFPLSSHSYNHLWQGQDEISLLSGGRLLVSLFIPSLIVFLGKENMKNV